MEAAKATKQDYNKEERDEEEGREGEREKGGGGGKALTFGATGDICTE